MFDNLRNAFSNAAKSLGEKELNEKDIEDHNNSSSNQFSIRILLPALGYSA